MVKRRNLKLFLFFCVLIPIIPIFQFSNIPIFYVLDDDRFLDRLDDIIGVIGEVKNIEVIG